MVDPSISVSLAIWVDNRKSPSYFRPNEGLVRLKEMFKPVQVLISRDLLLQTLNKVLVREYLGSWLVDGWVGLTSD